MLRVFLKWVGTIEAVLKNLYDKLIIPSASPEEERRDEMQSNRREPSASSMSCILLTYCSHS